MRRRGLLLLAVASASVVLGVAPAGAQGGPRVHPAAAAGAPGSKVFVDLMGWAPYATVTLQVCGNLARRGSQDCDQIGAHSIEIRDPNGERPLITITAPPMPCPCVIRANDLNSEVVVSAPFTVVGHPVGQLVSADPAHAPPPVRVTATMRTEGGSLLAGLRRSLAGSATRRLELHVENVSGQPLRAVVVSAALGRKQGGGEALDAPKAFDLESGASRDVSVPVEVSPPVWGTYHVSGSVFVDGVRVSFADTTSNVPWLLILLALAVVVDVVALVLVTAARHRASTEDELVEASGTDREPNGEPPVTARPTVGELALHRSFGLPGDP